MMRLTKSEMEIMTVLWEADHPLSRTEILENSKEKSWKDSSIHILLNSMLEKGAVEVAGFEKMGSHYGRTYAPALSEPSMQRSRSSPCPPIKSLRDRPCGVFSAHCWMAAMWMMKPCGIWKKCCGIGVPKISNRSVCCV